MRQQKRCLAVLLALVLAALLLPAQARDPGEQRSGDWGYTLSGSGATIQAFYGAGPAADIPETVGGQAVTAIASSALAGNTAITSLTIPSRVTQIGRAAFSGCTALSRIQFNAVNCTSIGMSCFDNAGQNAASLSVAFGPGVTAVPAGMFSSLLRDRCPRITAVTIPASVTEIGANAFAGCQHLSSIIGGDGLRTIGASAFQDCYNLTSVTIPAGVTSLGADAFSGCTRLSSIRFQAVNCADLTLGSAFDNAGVSASGLDVVFGGGVRRVPGGLFQSLSAQSYPRITSVTIPGTVREIGTTAFYGCWSLSRLSLGDGLVQIGSYAFSGCATLGTVTIPASVTDIGAGAFNNCPRLTIRAKGGTAAQQYAQENNIPFQELVDQIPAPTLRSLRNEKAGLRLSWSKVTGAVKYRVFLKQNGAWKGIGSTTNTSFLWKQASSGSRYTLAVRCVTASGKSASKLSGAKSITRLSVPALTRLTNPRAGALRAFWEKTPGAGGYQLQYSLSRDFTSGRTTKRFRGGGVSARTFDSLLRNKTYYVRIRAWKQINGAYVYSAWSGTKTIKLTK